MTDLWSGGTTFRVDIFPIIGGHEVQSCFRDDNLGETAFEARTLRAIHRLPVYDVFGHYPLNSELAISALPYSHYTDGWGAAKEGSTY